MELHQLRYVLAVAETGSFSRAAEQLFVVQSNVSAQVRKLEHELGVELFERRAHAVVLTVFGRAFLPAARQTLGAVEEARAAVDAVRGIATGHAALGVAGTVAPWLLPRVLQRFRETHPSIDLWITEEASVILANMVAARDLPQAIVNLPVRRADLLDVQPLFDEALVVVVPPKHPAAGTRSAPLADFASDELLLPEAGNQLRDLVLEACLRAGFTPNPRMEFGKKQLVHQMAVAGVGTALMPAMTAWHDLHREPGRIIWIEHPRVTRSVGLVRRRGASVSPADAALAEMVCAILQEIVADAPGPATLAPLLLADSTSKR